MDILLVAQISMILVTTVFLLTFLVVRNKLDEERKKALLVTTLILSVLAVATGIVNLLTYVFV